MSKKHYGSYFDDVKKKAEEPEEVIEIVADRDVVPEPEESEIADSFIKDVAAVEDKLPRKGSVNTPRGVNVRRGMSTMSDVVCILSHNDVVTVEESQDPDWYFVTTADQRMGFVMKRFITII